MPTEVRSTVRCRCRLASGCSSHRPPCSRRRCTRSSSTGWFGVARCMTVSVRQRKSPRAIAAGLNKEPVTFRVCLRKVQRGREEISLRPGVKGRWCSGFDCRRGADSQMRTWVNKRCCTIWSDHFCHRRGYRAEDPQNRLLWLIPEIKRTRLSGHTGWPRYSPAGEGTCAPHAG